MSTILLTQRPHDDHFCVHHGTNFAQLIDASSLFCVHHVTNFAQLIDARYQVLVAPNCKPRLLERHMRGVSDPAKPRLTPTRPVASAAVGMTDGLLQFVHTNNAIGHSLLLSVVCLTRTCTPARTPAGRCEQSLKQPDARVVGLCAPSSSLTLTSASHSSTSTKSLRLGLIFAL